MGKVRNTIGVLVFIGVLGLLLPTLVVAAALCEPCNPPACDAGLTCGQNINDPNDWRCIPNNVQTYNCSEESDSG